MNELYEKLQGQAQEKDAEVGDEPTAELSPKSKAAADELIAAIKSIDTLDTHHKLVIKMRRDSQNNPKYKDANTADKKKAYKLEWLQLQLKNVQQTAVHTKRVTEKKKRGGVQVIRCYRQG